MCQKKKKDNGDNEHLYMIGNHHPLLNALSYLLYSCLSLSLSHVAYRCFFFFQAAAGPFFFFFVVVDCLFVLFFF